MPSAPVAMDGTGESDSPVEGTGFEPSVPPAGHRTGRGITRREPVGHLGMTASLAQKTRVELRETGSDCGLSWP